MILKVYSCTNTLTSDLGIWALSPKACPVLFQRERLGVPKVDSRMSGHVGNWAPPGTPRLLQMLPSNVKFGKGSKVVSLGKCSLSL